METKLARSLYRYFSKDYGVGKFYFEMYVRNAGFREEVKKYYCDMALYFPDPDYLIGIELKDWHSPLFYSTIKKEFEGYKGVLNAFHMGWLDNFSDGQHFGELIGPKFGTDDSGNVNPYGLDRHIFYPFKRAREKLEMKSYGKYGTSFEDIREWFMEKGLLPLFYSRWFNLNFAEAEEEGYVEGVVFWHPETGKMAKLRTDMFEEYKGNRH